MNENLALSLYIVFFEKEVKLAGVFWLPLTLGATSENKYSREKTALFHYFFLQRRTPDELNNFKNINSSLQLLGGDYFCLFFKKYSEASELIFQHVLCS